MKSTVEQRSSAERVGMWKKFVQGYHKRFVRNIELGSLLETFLVCSVAAVLLIRFYLAVTGYPQIGGGGFHIAHLLWGGFFMLTALVLLLGFQGKRVQFLAATVGGIGFGTFIDELGKFITSDNNYFFRPTIAMIYVIFVLLLLVFRTLEHQRKFSEREKVAAAIDLLQEAMMYGWTAENKEEALELLYASRRRRDPVIISLRTLIEQMPVRKDADRSVFARISDFIQEKAQYVLRSPLLTRIVLGVLIAGAFFSTLMSSLMIVLSDPMIVFQLISSKWMRYFDETCLFVTSIISDLFLLIGAWYLLRNKALQAYRWFKRALLVSIFLTQVFLFYIEQLSALGGLFFSLVALIVVESLLHREETKYVAQHQAEVRRERHDQSQAVS